MLRELAKCEKTLSLPASLEKLIASGFENDEDCYVLSELTSESASKSKSNFSDKTGYETFVNSIHVYDFADTGDLSIGVCFVNALFDEWVKNYPDQTLRAIVSLRDEDTVVKWHVVRQETPYLSDYLEGFQEAILEIDSGDTRLLTS